jgi:hypothetical protein
MSISGPAQPEFPTFDVRFSCPHLTAAGTAAMRINSADRLVHEDGPCAAAQAL